MNDIEHAISILNQMLGRTELFGQGNAQKIQELINCGLEVNVLDDTGDTPLTTCHSLEAIKVLIKNGADVNFSKSVSAFSQWHLKSEITHYLFEQGAMYNKYRDVYEPEVVYETKFPYDEYSCKYIESQDEYRRKLALVLFSSKYPAARRISYEEACKRTGGTSKLNELIKEANKIYLETKEVVPFSAINGRIFAYVL